MSNLQISWVEYHSNIEQLAIQIAESDWQFKQIVCLARGGLRVGDILSRIFAKPLAILAVSSYSKDGQRDALKFSTSITMTTATLAQPLLLVDDLVDSGETLRHTIAWLEQHHGIAIAQIRTAVIWYKGCSICQPDYYLEYLTENPWIVQPFEFYENIDLAKLKKQHSKIS
jgi:uncharacterized protein